MVLSGCAFDFESVRSPGVAAFVGLVIRPAVLALPFSLGFPAAPPVLSGGAKDRLLQRVGLFVAQASCPRVDCRLVKNKNADGTPAPPSIFSTSDLQLPISMSLRHIALAVAASAAIALLIVSWRQSRADRAQLQSVLAAQQQLIAAASSHEQSNADALQSALAEIAALKRRVQTPQQVVASLPQYLPLPQPITLAPKPNPAVQQSPAPLAAAPQQGTVPGKGTALPAKSDAPLTSVPSSSLLPDSPTPRRSSADLVAALKSAISDLKPQRVPSASSPTSSTPSALSGTQSSCPPALSPAPPRSPKPISSLCMTTYRIAAPARPNSPPPRRLSRTSRRAPPRSLANAMPPSPPRRAAASGAASNATQPGSPSAPAQVLSYPAPAE